MKLKEIPVSEDNTNGNYMHYCPGCKQLHMINTLVRNNNGAIWSFDGDVNNPTFSPSIHIHSTDAKGNRHTSCHYFIKSGYMHYCNDSRHELSGQIVELPNIPEGFL